VTKDDQYRRQAEDWTERQYADASSYLAHRADLIVALGPRLQPGDEVLDLACGDGGLGELLLARGLRYRGVDATTEMVDEARRRLGPRASIDHGDLESYVPPAPVAATTVFRAIYYASDRLAFFRHVAGFTDRKLVFDLNPRQYRVDDVLADLRVAGWSRRPSSVLRAADGVAGPAARGRRAWSRALRPARPDCSPLSVHVPRRSDTWRTSQVRLEARSRGE
jgi:SAM-dependent methyltransferase